MKIKLRSKGDLLLVCDEAGNEIEGVTEVCMQPWHPGEPPRFMVAIAFKGAAVDVEAESIPPHVAAEDRAQDKVDPKS